MPDEWVDTTLGQACTITIGRTPPRNEPMYWTEDLTRPFCTIAEMKDALVDPIREGVTERAEQDGKAKRVPAGSLLMSFKLTIGRVGFAARDLFPNEAIAWLKVTDLRLDESYLALWLGSRDLTEGSGRAAKGRTLNSESMRTIPVLFPPLRTQRRIVDLMAHLDSHLANLRAERETASQLLVTLRDELLTPVEGWMQSSLRDVTTKIGSGATPRGGESAYVQEGIALIRSQNVYDHHFAWDGLARITDSQARLLDGVTVEGGDVLINITGASVNRLCRVPTSVLPARVNQHVAILRPDPSILDSTFLAHLLRRSDLKRGLDVLSGSGSTRQAITKAQLESFLVSLPEITEQRRLSAALEENVHMIDCISKEVETLEMLRAQSLNAILAVEASLGKDYDRLLPGTGA